MMAVRERPNSCAVDAYWFGTGWRGWKRVSKASKVRRRVRYVEVEAEPMDLALLRRWRVDMLGGVAVKWYDGWRGVLDLI